jgi:hypothetical protein
MTAFKLIENAIAQAIGKADEMSGYVATMSHFGRRPILRNLSFVKRDHPEKGFRAARPKLLND